MRRKRLTPSAGTTMSMPTIWRQGCRRAASGSIPRARASMRARSRTETMTWSRRAGESSRSVSRASTNTTSPVIPAMWNWSSQALRWSSVLEATSDTIRLPMTGPSVHSPMAVPRRTWGEKSRTRAGVATNTIPSTNPTAAMQIAYQVALGADGMPNAVIRLATNRPDTTRLARPHRSARPARREDTAPATLAITTTVR